MNIVGSSYFLRNIRDLDFFTLDFGKSKKDAKTDKFRKLDEFIVKYRNLYNKQIMKFGKIGDKVLFYEDLSMNNNEYIIFNDDNIYEITFDNNEIKNMKQYILGILRKVEQIEDEEDQMNDNNQKLIEELSENGGWVAEDDKNFGKKYLIDQTLSKEDYRKEVLKRIKGKN